MPLPTMDEWMVGLARELYVSRAVTVEASDIESEESHCVTLAEAITEELVRRGYQPYQSTRQTKPVVAFREQAEVAGRRA